MFSSCAETNLLSTLCIILFHFIPIVIIPHLPTLTKEWIIICTEGQINDQV